MSATGSIQSLGGGAPAPDMDRVAQVRSAITNDAETAATFAKQAAERLTERIARAQSAADASVHAEAASLLSVIRDRVAGLDPSRLQPRSGLAGLFDSRNKRLKTLRAAFATARDAAISASADLMDRAGVVSRRQAELDALWSELRDAVVEVDAHIAAGWAWLTDRPGSAAPAVPPEAAAAFEDTPDPADDPPVEGPADGPSDASNDPAPSAQQAPQEADTRPADLPNSAMSIAASGASDGLSDTSTPTGSVVALPHPLETRLRDLTALRQEGIGELPRIRAVQNAEHAVPAALQSARHQVEGWAADWKEALGLNA